MIVLVDELIVEVITSLTIVITTASQVETITSSPYMVDELLKCLQMDIMSNVELLELLLSLQVCLCKCNMLDQLKMR